MFKKMFSIFFVFTLFTININNIFTAESKVNIYDDSIFDAIKNNDAEYIQKYISQGGNPNKLSKDGISILKHAVNYNNTSIIKILIDSKADVNLKSSKITPLMTASSKGNIEVVDLLIKANADVNAKTNRDENFKGQTSMAYNRTALMFAADNQDASCLVIVKKLIDAGADVKAVDSYGDTAYDKLKYHDHPQKSKLKRLLYVQKDKQNNTSFPLISFFALILLISVILLFIFKKTIIDHISKTQDISNRKYHPFIFSSINISAALTIGIPVALFLITFSGLSNTFGISRINSSTVLVNLTHQAIIRITFFIFSALASLFSFIFLPYASANIISNYFQDFIKPNTNKFLIYIYSLTWSVLNLSIAISIYIIISTFFYELFNSNRAISTQEIIIFIITGLISCSAPLSYFFDKKNIKK